ncbi:MAG: hypothetical protein M1526_03650 [Candidatus Thermoplasmatota archaeon]|nr:hypothetical protein [Candidatus Thermoplasmatota archaeon]
MDLRVFLEEIIRRMGYRTYPGYPEEYIWIDHGDGSGEVIMLLEDSSLERVKSFYSSTVNFPGEKFVFFLVDEDPEITSYCKSKGIKSVRKDEVGLIVGRSIIDIHLKKRRENDFKEDEKDSIYVYLEEGSNPKFVKPAITGEAVANALGLKADLLFIPFSFYSYSVSVMEGSLIEKREGTVMVNTVNGTVSKSISGYEVIDSWPMQHRELEPKWEPDASIERVRRWIQDNIESEVVEEKEMRYLVVFTRKKVRPLENSIKIKYNNTHLYPIYSSSSLVMDGFTGEIKSVTDYI